jgi:hypothetical protein
MGQFERQLRVLKVVLGWHLQLEMGYGKSTAACHRARGSARSFQGTARRAIDACRAASHATGHAAA